ncbi:solute carrier family 23 protein, partial [Klebsiella pneumoniae]
LPTSTFSQNVGIVAMTKVISRSVLAIAGVFMVLAGLSPKFSAIMTTIPYPVLGGATITVFGMITMTGIQLLIKDELSARNVT